MAIPISTFDRAMNRIRRFLYPVFKPARHYKRIAESASPQRTDIDLLTINIPQKSLGDEICWDAIESGLVLRRGEKNIEIQLGRPLPTINLPERQPNNDVCWEILFQDVLEKSAPFFSFASVRISDKPNPIDELPAFRLFNALPFELRLKIWHLTIPPRLVHWNIVGAKRSSLTIDRQPPVILQVCKESRAEGLQIFALNPKATCPIFFNPKADTLLWTRYPNCPRTFNEDAERLLKSPILGKVRHIAILLRYWNMLLSHEGSKDVYTAIRKAPNLEVLTLVDDYFIRRTGYSQVTYRRVMHLLEICPEENESRTVRWEKELGIRGKEKLWKKWDVNLTDCQGVPRRKSPEIKFARVVVVELP